MKEKMEAKRLFNVTRKEFIDHITSKKFVLILALFLIISAVAMHGGVGDYNNRLEDYKEQISQIEEKEGPHTMPRKPSILLIFQRMNYLMAWLGAVLAIAMGFDLITREKESHSLKSLLSHPVYRDEIINGKAVGGILALVFAVGIAFILLFAMLLIFTIVPSMNEFARIMLFGAVTVLCLLTYFSIALVASAISENSGKSFMYAFVIFLILSFGVPMLGGVVAKHVVGEPPEPPEFWGYTANVEEAERHEEEWGRFEEEQGQYWEKRRAIGGTVNVIVPDRNFNIVSEAVLNLHPSGERISLQDILKKIWKNIFALIVLPVVFFAIAYIKFMRMDIR